MQLDRILQSQGFGSRKECRKLVRDGEVKIGGVVATDPFAEYEEKGFQFEIAEWEWEYSEKVYVALYKPAGYECSHKPKHNESIYHLLPEPLVARDVQSVGRLDVDTTGLLLFSDDGQFIHAISSAKRQVTKSYRATTNQPVRDEEIAQLLAGVQLIDEPEPVAALEARKVGEKQIELVIDHGKYHLVKRMIAAAGNHVDKLHRYGVGGLSMEDGTLPEMEPEDWCYLRPKHLALLGYQP
ncbi:MULTISPECIES: pseudouridine synthase [unclassified Uliginosibacterium]|uniref:pseudouridine synthase n=1 Tax=unclassified Uliginosibacterium TaxID=2621521 RepID=UPI000C7E3FCA|nr:MULTISPECIES: pseudouridine synthase [unclassified Uliginosibacterium]MDO6385889.1 pseudouridine synthase [Uliginosibacterium sp. 31-12]PLK49903.1 16S rRNA pseudouridine(516) synthase [Uliginosibacterium sp. TH139]